MRWGRIWIKIRFLKIFFGSGSGLNLKHSFNCKVYRNFTYADFLYRRLDFLEYRIRIWVKSTQSRCPIENRYSIRYFYSLPCLLVNLDPDPDFGLGIKVWICIPIWNISKWIIVQIRTRASLEQTCINLLNYLLLSRDIICINYS